MRWDCRSFDPRAGARLRHRRRSAHGAARRRSRRHAGRDRRPDRAVGLGQVVACCMPRACWSTPTPGASPSSGRDCTDLPDRDRTRVRLATIGFVYQFHHLLPEFSALDNVALPLMIAGVPRKAAASPCRGAPQANSAWPSACSTSRPRCPAANSSASPSPARWPIRRACCWPTSPPATSTPHLDGGVREPLRARAAHRRRRPGRHPQPRARPPHGPGLRAEGRPSGSRKRKA